MGNKNPWNKGKTKNDHPTLAMVSRQRREKNNFSAWYEQRKKEIEYVQPEQSAAYAELYGAILGDGCIERYERTERLIISFNSNEVEHIAHIKRVVEHIFKKEAKLRRRKNANCIDVYIYQKYLSERLDFPTGIKFRHELHIPQWVKDDESYLIKCLKGLFEADGSWVIDKKNGTNVMSLKSVSKTLLGDVYEALLGLGFSPKLYKLDVRLARKVEVEKFAKLIKFRQY